MKRWMIVTVNQKRMTKMNDSLLFSNMLGLPASAPIYKIKKSNTIGYSQEKSIRKKDCVGCGKEIKANIWNFPSFDCSAYMGYGSVKKSMYHKGCALKVLAETIRLIKND